MARKATISADMCRVKMTFGALVTVYRKVASGRGLARLNFFSHRAVHHPALRATGDRPPEARLLKRAKQWRLVQANRSARTVGTRRAVRRHAKLGAFIKICRHKPTPGTHISILISHIFHKNRRRRRHLISSLMPHP